MFQEGSRVRVIRYKDIEYGNIGVIGERDRTGAYNVHFRDPRRGYFYTAGYFGFELELIAPPPLGLKIKVV